MNHLGAPLILCYDYLNMTKAPRGILMSIDPSANQPIDDKSQLSVPRNQTNQPYRELKLGLLGRLIITFSPIAFFGAITLWSYLAGYPSGELVFFILMVLTFFSGLTSIILGFIYLKPKNYNSLQKSIFRISLSLIVIVTVIFALLILGVILFIVLVASRMESLL